MKYNKTTISFICFLCFCFLSLLAYIIFPYYTGKVYWEKAERLEEIGENAKAISNYKKYLMKNPEDYDTRLKLADLLFEQKEENQAKIVLENLFSDIPSKLSDREAVPYICEIGKRYLDNKNYLDAGVKFRIAKDFCSSDHYLSGRVDGWIEESKFHNARQKGNDRFDSKDFTRARIYYREALTVLENKKGVSIVLPQYRSEYLCELAYNIGVTYLKEKNFSEAKKKFLYIRKYFPHYMSEKTNQWLTLIRKEGVK